MMRLLPLAFVALASLTPAYAEPLEPLAAAKLRQGYFKLLGAEMAPLAAMAKGDAPFDASAVTLRAANLRALAGYDIARLFPEGSDNSALAGETRALPMIFAMPEEFAGGFDTMAHAVEPVAQATDADSLAEALGGLGASCKACHRIYRSGEF